LELQPVSCLLPDPLQVLQGLILYIVPA
jgi:hypothetical protein